MTEEQPVQGEWNCTRCGKPVSKCAGHDRSDKFKGIKQPPREDNK